MPLRRVQYLSFSFTVFLTFIPIALGQSLRESFPQNDVYQLLFNNLRSLQSCRRLKLIIGRTVLQTNPQLQKYCLLFFFSLLSLSLICFIPPFYFLELIWKLLSLPNISLGGVAARNVAAMSFRWM